MALVGEAGRDVQTGTFHAVCARVLRRDGEAIGHRPRFVIYDTDDQQTLMKQLLREEDLPDDGRVPAIGGARRDQPGEERDARRRRPSTRSPSTTTSGSSPGSPEATQARLKAVGALDFDDLLLEAVRLFDEAPDVLARYQDRWRYLHVDEYQDTNRPSTCGSAPSPPRHHNLAVVGDDDQSIYSWRGADLRNILDFERD